MTTESESGAPSMRRIATASVIGTAIEWYDVFIFATASAIVFNKVFFPTFDPLVGTLLAFGTFASAYVARLAGAVVFGHFGDRVGRKSMLLVSLVVMGLATFGIGLLPTYASIGVWAPILLLLLRIIQGLAVGGEWGGAVLMVVEHSTPGRRGFAGSLVQLGVPLGTLAANGVFLLVALQSPDDLLSWGWRIPFLASIVLIGFGFYIRLSVTETPAFERMREARTRAQVPAVEVFRKFPLQTVLGGVAGLSAGVVFNILVTSGLTYATTSLQLPRGSVLAVVLAANVFAVMLIPVFGRLADQYGTRAVMTWGLVAEGVLLFPLFWLLDTRNIGLALIGYLLVMGAFAANYAPLSTYLAGMFGTRVRYSGLSISYMLAGLLGSAATPVVTTALLKATGSASSIAWYGAGAAALSFIAILLLRGYPNRLASEVEEDEAAEGAAAGTSAPAAS